MPRRRQEWRVEVVNRPTPEQAAEMVRRAVPLMKRLLREYHKAKDEDGETKDGGQIGTIWPKEAA